MKKILLLVFMTLLCTSVDAQRNGQPRRGGGRTIVQEVAEKKHAFYLGLKGGVTLTSMTQPDECDLYDGSGLGFSGGIVGKVRFNPANTGANPGTGLLGVGLELKYKQNTVKTIATNEKGESDAKLSVGYFEVPVYLQVYPFYKSDNMNNFYIEAGPSFAGTLSRSPKTLTVDGLSGQYGSVIYNIDENGTKLKGMDVRVMAGIGYDFAIKNEKGESTNLIGINGRYYMGTSKLAKNFNCKMSTIEISLSWMFNIGKL